MIKEGVFLGKRYEILGRIGSGGMADVYKGKDHKLNRFVAIKVLKSTYRSDETFIKNMEFPISIHVAIYISTKFNFYGMLGFPNFPNISIF